MEKWLETANTALVKRLSAVPSTQIGDLEEYDTWERVEYGARNSVWRERRAKLADRGGVR